jgi:hypothetical protein
MEAGTPLAAYQPHGMAQSKSVRAASAGGMARFVLLRKGVFLGAGWVLRPHAYISSESSHQPRPSSSNSSGQGALAVGYSTECVLAS